jgi:signal peptidase I
VIAGDVTPGVWASFEGLVFFLVGRRIGPVLRLAPGWLSDGIPAEATVTATGQTGIRVNGRSVARLDLDVTPRNEHPYPVRVQQPVPEGLRRAVEVGSRLRVRIHPADRHAELPRDRFVKRIIGLPGDTIEVRDGRVALNGIALDRRDLGTSFVDGMGSSLRFEEEVLDGQPHAVLSDPGSSSSDQAPFRVEPGRYFMMGDNRDHSNDSRSWGTVRFEEFKGPAFILYWSWDWNGSWGELLLPTTWWSLFSEKMRWERIGDRIR